MKRVFAGLLCVCLLLLVGCGQPKEYPPYYPHSDTLRLDASAEEILAATEMKPVKEGMKFYEAIEPILWDGLKYSMTMVSDEDNAPRVYYVTRSTESDLSEVHAAWKKHFSEIYGKPSKANDSEVFMQCDVWKFQIDTGDQYTIGLVQDYYTNTEPKKYLVQIDVNKSKQENSTD
ncbi:MAG: hypothetical protein RSD27_09570 [Ruthenibacterium sp.]